MALVVTNLWHRTSSGLALVFFILLQILPNVEAVSRGYLNSCHWGHSACFCVDTSSSFALSYLKLSNLKYPVNLGDNWPVMGAHLPSLSPFKGKLRGSDGTALLLTPSTEYNGDRVTPKLCWASIIADAWLLSSSPAKDFQSSC